MEDRPVYKFKSVHVTDAPPIAGSFPLPHSKYTGRTTKKPMQREYHLQCVCVCWFGLQYPDLLLFSVPNGERRDAITGAKLKKAGVISGIPDLCLPVARGGYHGLYIELKTDIGHLSPNQRHICDKLQQQGYLVEIVRGLDCFMQVMNDYLSGVLTAAHD